jgi:hypothetical protein
VTVPGEVAEHCYGEEHGDNEDRQSRPAIGHRYSELSNEPPLGEDGCAPPLELDGRPAELLGCGLAVTGADVLTGAGWATGATCVDELGVEAPEVRSASGCDCTAALAALLAEAAGETALRAGLGAIALGTLPAIGESPRSPPGIAAWLENARSAEDGSPCAAPPAPSRPIAKKQTNTTTAASSNVGHCPFMLASGPPIRTANRS